MINYPWKTSPVVKRYEGNPILTSAQAPYPSSMTYNAGVVKFKGQYVMMFRNLYWDNPYKHYIQGMGLATSPDGLKWTVEKDFKFKTDGVVNAEDPRLTVIEGRVYVCFAENSPDGMRGGVAVTDDFKTFETLTLTEPDNRDLIMFPERVRGKLARLDRPFRSYGIRGGSEFHATWYSESPDGRHWGNHHVVLKVPDVPFCNLKNGSSGQPIKTKAGWLTIFHAAYVDPAITYPTWRNEDIHWVYSAGIMLLDLEEPWKIRGLSKEPLLVPEPPYEYEVNGYRSYTVFPSATILEDDGTVRIYYGAADTSVALATANVDDLIALCKPV